MTNKLKLTACLIAGSILTACVGSIDASGKEGTSEVANFDPATPSKPIAHTLPIPKNGAFRSTGFDNSPSCLLSCYGKYNYDYTTAPLIDVAGTATYSGTISYSVRKNLIYSATLFDTVRRSGNAEFKVNFASKTINYDGSVPDGFGRLSGSMRATFNGKGQIRGTITVSNREGEVIGIIGQSELIGVFANEDNVYAGGFTASRD